MICCNEKLEQLLTSYHFISLIHSFESNATASLYASKLVNNFIQFGDDNDLKQMLQVKTFPLANKLVQNYDENETNCNIICDCNFMFKFNLMFITIVSVLFGLYVLYK